MAPETSRKRHSAFACASCAAKAGRISFMRWLVIEDWIEVTQKNSIEIALQVVPLCLLHTISSVFLPWRLWFRCPFAKALYLPSEWQEARRCRALGMQPGATSATPRFCWPGTTKTSAARMSHAARAAKKNGACLGLPCPLVEWLKCKSPHATAVVVCTPISGKYRMGHCKARCSRRHSKPAPGSALRPGATCSWPTTAAIG